MGIKRINECGIGDIEQGSYKKGEPDVVVEKSSQNGNREIITLWKNNVDKFQVCVTYASGHIEILKNIPGSNFDGFFKPLSEKAAWEEYKEGCRLKGCNPYPNN